MKKGAKKSSRAKTSSVHRVSQKNENIEKALIDNFIAIQKVLTNLSVKFDNLSGNMQKLLDVFEISAKSLAEKDFKDFGKFDDKKIMEKLDSLLDQNKTIAKGLILMHERTSPQEPMQVQPMPVQMPQRTQQRPYQNYGYGMQQSQQQTQTPLTRSISQNDVPMAPGFQQEDTYTRSIAQQEPQDNQRYKQIQKG